MRFSLRNARKASLYALLISGTSYVMRCQEPVHFSGHGFVRRHISLTREAPLEVMISVGVLPSGLRNAIKPSFRSLETAARYALLLGKND